VSFFIIRFVIVWTFWVFFADKKRWREIAPACVFAGYMAGIADGIVEHYKLWAFIPVSIIPDLLDNIGIYPVVTYFFIQWLPKQCTLGRMFSYWFVWTTLTIGIELLHLKTGHMEHYMWWSIYHSYTADWILLWMIYQFHKIFRLEKLNY